LGLDINGENVAAGADGPGEAPGEIAGASADVDDGGARFEVEETEDRVGTFFGFAFGTFEPIGAFVAHDAGDFTIEKEFADAIGSGGTELVEVGR
jgi:hypothetical protein